MTDERPAPPHPMFRMSPWAARYLLRKLIGDARERRADLAAGRRLYITRGKAAGRHIANEDELCDLLARQGFKTVDLAGRSVIEQAELMRDAAWIVAVHGAGMANAVFASRGARLLELAPHSYGTPAYYTLAAARGLHYGLYVTAPEDVIRGKTAQLDNFRVRPEVIARDFAAFLPPG